MPLRLFAREAGKGNMAHAKHNIFQYKKDKSDKNGLLSWNFFCCKKFLVPYRSSSAGYAPAFHEPTRIRIKAFHRMIGGMDQEMLLLRY